MRWGGGKGREGKQEWEAVVLIPFIERWEGEAVMGGALWCDPLH